MSRTYDWQGWLNAQQQLVNHSYEHLLQNAIFSNALHGSSQIWQDGITPSPIVLEWQGLDFDETYVKNLADPQQRALLEQWGWIDRKFDYRINSWGFRSEREFDTVTGPSLITMGCSFTFGTGLPVESIWPTLVSERLDLELINLGTPGHGLELNTQWLLSQGHTIKDPRAIAILMPPSGRVTWVEEINDKIIGNTFLMSQLQYPKIMNNVAINAHMHYVRSIQTIQLWAQSRGIPVHVFAGFDGLPNTFGLARDLRHNGEPWHQLGAEQVYNRIKNY